jgi:hypothetical protein
MEIGVVPEMFEDNEDGYTRWAADHRQGFVLRTPWEGMRGGTTLHAADCSHIAPVADWKHIRKLPTKCLYTRKPNAKVCSLSRDALIGWAREHDRVLKYCPDCDV